MGSRGTGDAVVLAAGELSDTACAALRCRLVRGDVAPPMSPVNCFALSFAFLLSYFLAFLLSCFHAFLLSCFLAFLLSCYLAILLS